MKKHGYTEKKDKGGRMMNENGLKDLKIRRLKLGKVIFKSLILESSNRIQPSSLILHPFYVLSVPLRLRVLFL